MREVATSKAFVPVIARHSVIVVTMKSDSCAKRDQPCKKTRENSCSALTLPQLPFLQGRFENAAKEPAERERNRDRDAPPYAFHAVARGG